MTDVDHDDVPFFSRRGKEYEEIIVPELEDIVALVAQVQAHQQKVCLNRLQQSQRSIAIRHVNVNKKRNSDISLCVWHLVPICQSP